MGAFHYECRTCNENGPSGPELPWVPTKNSQEAFDWVVRHASHEQVVVLEPAEGDMGSPLVRR